jgi:serine/threonine protein kinase
MFVCPICRRTLSEEATCPADGIEAVEVPEHLIPPEVADQFGIKECYGGGDMGALYRAYDGRSSSWGLLKLMALSASASDAGRQRLSRDLERQVKLSTSTRVSLARRAEVDGSLAWVFRPWIEGESLESRLFRDERIGLVHAMTITAKIAQALDELHCAGLVHGSLHPGHVILVPSDDDTPDVALIDASIVGDAQRGSAFEDLGDLFYMSPEQIKGKAWGFRSDLYALGCVFYEMIVGEPPFDADSAEAVMAAHQFQIPKLPDALLPASVAQLLGRMLAKVPADRPMSTREIISTLKPYVGDIEPTRASSHPPAPIPLERRASAPEIARASSAPPPARASSAPPPARASSAPPPAISLAAIAARKTASAAVVRAPAPSMKVMPAPAYDAEPARRKRRDPSSIQIVLSEFADVAERTGSFVIQKTARLPWLSLGILIGVLCTAGTAYAMALGGQFHLITETMKSYLAVPAENLEPAAAPISTPEAVAAPESEPVTVSESMPLSESDGSESDGSEPDESESDESESDVPESDVSEADGSESALDAASPEPVPSTEVDEAQAERAEAQAERAEAARARRVRQIRTRRARARRAAMQAMAVSVDGLAL